MKRKFILASFFAITAAIFLTSCQPSRVWATKKRPEYREEQPYRYSTPPPPPPNYRYVALIITPSPGFVMRQDDRGRFYHRSNEGFIYWKGNDNRFYLDRRDIS